ncbi:MBL fold metallo-hydrolase [Aliarcobacter sp. ERUVET-7]|uniref:MBL fold metallo-hydrolase n=1 Tax=Aliarcobacter sp. ERUVET-7 TaxID=3429683 RepID=UPI003D6B225F
MNKIIRTFHPVGQGAFYSERHENFNVVYDCGTEFTKRSDKGIKRTVETAFRKEEEIDILFISHFDFDHVGHIRTLKNSVKKIKKVVLPLLHNDIKILLASFYKGLGEDNVSALISNPQEFFGEETTIIEVELSENTETPIDNDLEHIEIDNLNSNQQSGKGIIKKFAKYEWIYIPYNHNYKSRRSVLETELTKAGFDVDKIKNDANYSLTESIINRKKLRKIYDTLTGKINENSMVVYSGIIQYPDSKFRIYNLFHNLFCMDDYFHYRFWRGHINDKISCIYTGDTDLNVVKIKLIFAKYWDSLGMIQIPHHGDINSFHADIFDFPRLYPISAGKNNIYGHPSDKVVIDILSYNSCPILVTEDKNSIFIQIIEIIK